MRFEQRSRQILTDVCAVTFHGDPQKLQAVVLQSALLLHYISFYMSITPTTTKGGKSNSVKRKEDWRRGRHFKPTFRGLEALSLSGSAKQYNTEVSVRIGELLCLTVTDFLGETSVAKRTYQNIRKLGKHGELKKYFFKRLYTYQKIYDNNTKDTIKNKQ